MEKQAVSGMNSRHSIVMPSADGKRDKGHSYPFLGHGLITLHRDPVMTTHVGETCLRCEGLGWIDPDSAASSDGSIHPCPDCAKREPKPRQSFDVRGAVSLVRDAISTVNRVLSEESPPSMSFIVRVPGQPEHWKLFSDLALAGAYALTLIFEKDCRGVVIEARYDDGTYRKVSAQELYLDRPDPRDGQ